MAWKFVQENWDELYNRYEGGFLLSRLIKVNSITLGALWQDLRQSNFSNNYLSLIFSTTTNNPHFATSNEFLWLFP